MVEVTQSKCLPVELILVKVFPLEIITLKVDLCELIANQRTYRDTHYGLSHSRRMPWHVRLPRMVPTEVLNFVHTDCELFQIQ